MRRDVGQPEQGDRKMPLGFCDEISVNVFVQVPTQLECRNIVNHIPTTNAFLTFSSVECKLDRSEWRNMIYRIIYNDSLRATQKP
jgi:hypothetical protein